VELYFRKENGSKRTIDAARSNWNHSYRSFQVMMAIINESIGDVFMPLHLAVMMGFTVAAGYLTIRFGTHGILIIIGGILTCGGLAVYYVILLGKGADSFSLGARMVELKKMGAKTELERKFLRSCKPLQLVIGEFGKLDRGTLLNVSCINFDNLVNVLLM